MPDVDIVSNHYTHGSLLDAIRAGVEGLGKSPDTVSVHDLGPVEEFHIGGRVATESFLDQLDLSSDHHVLDVGCGLGGASRFVAQRYGSRVTGIDLTHEYIETGRVLCSWLGLEHRVALDQGTATAMSYPDGTFDKAYMMHVGMNIADKQRLVSELHRVLRPGGYLGIYDVMRVGDGDLTFPVPWAASADASAVASPDEYKNALKAAGFQITAERNRRAFALDFFARLQAGAATAKGPPPLGLHILMGETAAMKVRNMIENISENRLAPVELIAEKSA
jgi:SAM-dependent methyltransferase